MTHLRSPFLYVATSALILLAGIRSMGSVQAESIFPTTLTGGTKCDLVPDPSRRYPLNGFRSSRDYFPHDPDGWEEVPPNRSPATGLGTFRLNDTSTALSFNV